MSQTNLILEAILAIPVLMLELIYVRHWIRDVYMASKGTTLKRFRADLKRFREYERKVRAGEVRESTEMQSFRIDEGTWLEFVNILVLLHILILYIYGLVLMIFYVCVTQTIWGVYPLSVVLVAWGGIAALGIAVFPWFWSIVKGILTSNLDAAYTFLMKFERLQRRQRYER